MFGRRWGYLLVLIIALFAVACSQNNQPVAPVKENASSAQSKQLKQEEQSKPQAAQAKPSPIKITMSLASMGYAWMPNIIAQQHGFFQQEGLDVEFVITKSQAAIAGLVGGEIDYVAQWGSSIQATIKGLPIKGVLVSGSRQLHRLIARPGITPQSDFSKLRLGISGAGATEDYVAEQILQKLGVNLSLPTKVNIGNTADKYKALVAGSIDLTPLSQPFDVKAEMDGFTVLGSGDIVEIPLGGISTTDAKIQQKPDEVKKIVRAMWKAMRFAVDNRDAAIKTMAKELKETNQEVVSLSYDIAIKSFAASNGEESPEILQLELSRAKAAGVDTKGVDPQKLVDFSFIRQVRNEK